jgi:hypothetical protein
MAWTGNGGDESDLVRQYVQNALSSPQAASLPGAGAGRLLLEALLILTEHRPIWSRVFEQIGKALATGDYRLWAGHLAELQRIVAHVLVRGEGSAFRYWMDGAQYSMKYAPFYHAIVAAIEGDDHLMRINPEVREPAARIHEGIARMFALYGALDAKKSRRAGSA